MKQWDKCLCYRLLKILVLLVLLSAGHFLYSAFVSVVGYFSFVKYCVMFVTHIQCPEIHALVLHCVVL